MAEEPIQRRLQFVLRAYERYPNQNITLCYFGMANEVFIVPTEQGKYVLKNCFKSNTHELISNEVALINHLNAHGCPTPEIIDTKDGSAYLAFDGQYYVMTEFCDDITFNWESVIPIKAHRETVHALADFHNAGESFTAPYPGQRFQFLDTNSAKQWLEQLAGDLANQDPSRESVKEMTALIPELRRRAQNLEDEIRSLDLSPLRKSYIHGDLHCYNLFYDTENNYTKVIDFDFARYDHRLADIFWSSRIFVNSELRKRYSRDELCADDFELPSSVAEEILSANWRMIITEYRKHAKLSKDELVLLHLFVKAVPLYVMRFFKFSNSEEECLQHIHWFRFEMDNSDKRVDDIQRVVTRIADELQY